MKKYNLLVVAHPDDETIFCGGLLQVYRRRPWKLICVTDGNADGKGPQRKTELAAACARLKVKDWEIWDFPDIYSKRLDLDALTAKLSGLTPSEVFTHGILGEYGHPHHQDVCLATHRAFPKLPVWSMAYNCFADKIFRLPRRAYERKCEILSEIYFSQTNRFARWLPAHNQEGFSQIKMTEVEAIYAHLAMGQPLTDKSLHAYAWFKPYLESYRQEINQRPF